MIDAERYRKIDGIFQAALELSPGERPSYISQACGGDEALLREVEYLLASDEWDWELMNTPAFEMASPLLATDHQDLSAGERLGHFSIVSLLGVGGMGQVYLAEDTRLGRKVALKLLPASFTRSPSRLSRFRQEARAASALNHPNIVTIYDIWEVEGRHLIATEYIEGETLRQRIKKGALSAVETLDISVQVVSALSAAHQAGIIHRDIKPENIMLRGDGLVKVLDFGLAKLTESAVADARRSDAAEETIAEPSFADDRKAVSNSVNTESGLLMGTLHYMSPEQLKGERLDARTDVFSLGVVIYEMLTGQAPSQGEKTGDVVAAILHQDAPSLLVCLPKTPTKLERIVAKALRKDCRERYQSVKEMLIDLRDLDKDLELINLEGRLAQGSFSGRKQSGANAWLGRWLAVWGSALVLAAASGLYWKFTRPPATPRSLRLSKLAAYGDYTSDPAVSADGKYLAFASNRAGEGHTDIWVRPFAQDEPIRLTNLPGNAFLPDFSPDGTQIAFESEGGDHDGIFVVSTSGGEPRLVAERGVGPRWSPDGQWLAYWVGPDSGSFGPDSARKVFLLPASGGEPQQFRPEFLTASFPVWSPDGKYMMFMGLRDREQGNNDWWVAPLEGGEAVKTGTIDIFLRHGFSAAPRRWTPDNTVLFTSQKDNGETCDVWRIPLEPGSWKTQDRPERVTSGTGFVTRVASLPDGRLVFADTRSSINLWSLPLNGEKGKVTGEPQQITRDEAHNIMPSLAADGDRLVYGNNRAGRITLWFRRLKSGKELRLNCPDWSYGPMISPDGNTLVFATNEEKPSADNSSSLFIMSIDGEQAERLIEERQLAPNGWLFTRNQVLYQAGDNDGEGSPQVFLLDINTKRPQMILEHAEYKFSEIYPSPDDRWISFVATRQGRRRVFIAPLHTERVAPESEWVAVTEEVRYEDQPRWSPSGKLLYFISARDGLRCIWAQPLDPVSKRPVGQAFAVYHFHDLQRNFGRITSVHDKIVFDREEPTGSIWLAEPQ
jgi:serine/threonine protein kinase/Tol biopolymer transport system component